MSSLLSTAQANLPYQTNRVEDLADLRTTMTLHRQLPPWATAAHDVGAVRSDTRLRLTLVLSRSADLQASFTAFLADQQTPGSANYHHWLTPSQVGELYGPTDHDVAALTQWLTSQGLSLIEVAPSHVFVTVEGSASTVATAFSTSFHYFEQDHVQMFSALVDPAIPSAFASVITSISGLSDGAIRPMHQAHAMPIGSGAGSGNNQPEFTSSASGHFVTPGDFATIFDLNPVYKNSGYTGTGQRVAIIGRSRVVSTDISEFEANTGVPTNLPNVVIPTTGVDPGVTGDGDQGEATLDFDRVIGTAPGVQADLVVSGSAGGYDGVYVAAQYEVQTLLDPVMNISFGSCEAYAGTSGVSLWDTLFSQAASEGISVFVSAADSGAATCDTQFAAPPVYQFRSINSICSSSYATCVGATEFADANYSLYWAPTNSSSRVSALGYIPEGSWNEPTSSSGLVVAAGGGGASIYVPKPIWQTGIGVPADNARDVPDVSFPGAAHDGYYACYANGGGDCANGYFEYFSGTSATAPAMAAVTALLNQKTGESQGNLNPLLYRVAASSPNAFHDATPASSGVAFCSISTPSMCNNSTSDGTSASVAGLAGFALTVGYDQATGLGSLDVANFLSAASAPVALLVATSLTVRGSAASITDNQSTVFTATLTSKTGGTPTGTVQFYADGSAIGSALPVIGGQAVTPATPFPTAGSYYITAMYSGDGTFAGVASTGFSLRVTGLAPLVTASSPNLTISAGGSSTFSVTVAPTAGTAIATGTVRFYVGTSTSGNYVATVPLSAGSASTPALTFSAAGSYNVIAYYSGDGVFSSGNSTPLVLTVQKLVSTAQVAASNPIAILQGSSFAFAVDINPYGAAINSNVASPTGNVQLYSNGLALGVPFPVTGNASIHISAGGSAPSIFPTLGSYAITAAYSGDANWLPSSAPAITLIVKVPPLYQLSAASPTLLLAPGATSGNTDVISLSETGGFTGIVYLGCTVTYTGTGTATDLPTCNFASSSLTVFDATPLPTTTLSISTTIPHLQRGTTTKAATGWSGWPVAANEVTLCALLLGFMPRLCRSKLPWRLLCVLMIVTAGLACLSGCGGGSSAAPTPSRLIGTTAGSYRVTVTSQTFTSGVIAPAPMTIALTVN